MRNRIRGSEQATSAAAAALFEGLETRTLLALIAWDGGPTGLGTDWHQSVNWAGDTLPGPGDDVTIGAGQAVEYSAGSLTLHSLVANRPLNVRGGELGVTASAMIADQVTLNGGGLAGGLWTIVGPGLVVTSNTGNSLTAATIAADVTLSDDNAFVRVTGGLTLNGLVSVSGPGAAISFDGGTQTFAGNVDVLFSGFTDVRSLSADAGAVVTIASTVSITGDKGRLVSGQFSGSGAFVNQGTIWADAPSGMLEILPAVFTNLGTLRATDFASLRIAAGLWTTSGVISTGGGSVFLAGTLDVTGGIGLFSRTGGDVFIEGTILNTASTLTLSAATGSWRFRGGTIVGGTVNVSPAGSLTDYPFTAGGLQGVTVNGNLVWQASNFAGTLDGVTINGNFDFGNFSSLFILNSLTLNGTLTVTGANTLVEFDTPSQQLLGDAIVLLRNEEAYFWAVGSLVLPASVSISGFGRIFGDFTSHASITADTAGKALMIGHGSFVSSGTISASGGKLYFGEFGGTPAQFTNNGQVTASGAAIVAIGPASDSGPVTFTNTSTVSVSGSAAFQVGNGLVFRQITLANSGSITISGTATATIGSLIAHVPVVLNNTGVISSQPGAAINIDTLVTTAQLGDLRAAGGVVAVHGVVNNQLATLAMNATSGSWLVQGGMIIGGTISLAGGANLVFDSSQLNVLSGVTVQGSLDLAQAGARVSITNGLTIQGTVSISGSGATLWLNGGPQAIGGKGQIVFSGTSGTQVVSADQGAAVTIGPGITVLGQSGDGRLSAGQVGGGSGAFINQGLIAGKVLINASSLSNAGVVEARDGKTLSITSALTNLASGSLTGGTWKVTGASTLSLPGPGFASNNATIVLSGSAAAWPALASLSNNSGTLTLAQGADLALPGFFMNRGTLELGPGSVMQTAGFTLHKSGSLHLSASSEGMPSLTSTATSSVYGSLSLSWLGGFTPGIGAYTLVSAPTIRGSFGATFVQAPGVNVRALLVYTPGGVTVHVLRYARH